MPTKTINSLRREPLPVDGLDLSNDDLILGTREMCGWLKISYPTFTRWRVAKKGPPFIRASSRSYLYRVGDVRKWMETRSRGTSEVTEAEAAA